MSATVIKYHAGMARWQPDARSRLGRAAMELYVERGFANTTVADIAERAGLTERTFFRYFADKREVLFSGSEELQELMVNAVRDAPSGVAPMEAASAGLEASAAVFQDRREFARVRNGIITATPELQERELIKLATLKSAMADALRGRGVTEPAASLTAEAAIGVFHVAFGRWVSQSDSAEFLDLIHETLEQFQQVASTAGFRARSVSAGNAVVHQG